MQAARRFLLGDPNRSRSQIPVAQAVVGAGHHQNRTCRRERRRPSQASQPNRQQLFVAGGRVPQGEATRRSKGSEQSAIGGERYPGQRHRRLALRSEASSRGRIPQSNRVIGAAGNQLLAVRGEGNGRHAVTMALRRMDLAARLRIPDPHRAIRAAGGQLPAIGRETDTQNAMRLVGRLTFVAGEGAAFNSPARVPQDKTIALIANGEGVPIQRKSQRSDGADAKAMKRLRPGRRPKVPRRRRPDWRPTACRPPTTPGSTLALLDEPGDIPCHF